MNLFASSFRAIEALYGKSIQGFRIAMLDDQTVSDWHKQWGDKPWVSKGQTGGRHFNWELIGNEQKNVIAIPHFERFGWALYVGSQLCGLASGYVWKQPSPDRSINLENVEGNPDKNHPLNLRVLNCFLDTAEEVARSGNLETVRAHRPDNRLALLYERRGYEFYGAASECNFFEKKVAFGD